LRRILRGLFGCERVDCKRGRDRAERNQHATAGQHRMEIGDAAILEQNGDRRRGRRGIRGAGADPRPERKNERRRGTDTSDEAVPHRPLFVQRELGAPFIRSSPPAARKLPTAL
jgi:hypothetical protein